MEITPHFEYQQRSDREWAIRKHQNENGSPSQRSSQMAAWLDTIPWQLFLTIRGDKGPVRLRQVMNEFRGNCEKAFHAPMTMVYSLESIPYWHAHTCVAASCNLRNWNFSFSHRILKHLLGSDPDAYDLQRYDPSQKGLAYVLKTIDYRWDDRSEWDLINCHFFIQSDQDDKRSRRRMRRHQERLAGAR